MARQTEQYNNLSETKRAKLRTAQRHLDGWIPLHTNKTRSGYEIVWSNDPPPVPPPKRNLTEQQLLNEIANERNVNII